LLVTPISSLPFSLQIKVGLVADKSVTSIGRQESGLALDEGTGTQSFPNTTHISRTKISSAGGNLNSISRIELMQKLSRSDRPAIELPKAPMCVSSPSLSTSAVAESHHWLFRFRPNIPQSTTRNVYVDYPWLALSSHHLTFLSSSMMKDAFDPAEETEVDWDTELRDDVKSEVESKYGKVTDIFVVKESQARSLPT
jgi:RNA-binding protein 39